MTLILASRPNVYSGSPLDRAAEKRDDTVWIEAALAHSDTLFVPVWRARNFIRGVDQGRPEAVYLSGAAAAALRLPEGGPWAFLDYWKGSRSSRAKSAMWTTRFLSCRPSSASSSTCEGWARRTSSRGCVRVRPCARYHELEAEAPVLRRLRRCLRAAQRGTRHALHRLRGAALSAHRSGRHHAGASRGRGPARTFAAVSPRELYSRWPASWSRARAWKRRFGARCEKRPEWRSARCSIIRASPGVPCEYHARLLRRGVDGGGHDRPERIVGGALVHRADLRAHRLGFSLPRRDSIARRLIEDWIAAE